MIDVDHDEPRELDLSEYGRVDAIAPMVAMKILKAMADGDLDKKLSVSVERNVVSVESRSRNTMEPSTLRKLAEMFPTGEFTPDPVFTDVFYAGGVARTKNTYTVRFTTLHRTEWNPSGIPVSLVVFGASMAHECTQWVGSAERFLGDPQWVCASAGCGETLSPEEILDVCQSPYDDSE